MAVVPRAIAEFSRLTDCEIATNRFDKKVGILPRPLRHAGYRCYEHAHVGRLVFVRRARELGFTLEEVRALLRLGRDGVAACNEVCALAASHHQGVRTRIADLGATKRMLAEAARRCDAGPDATRPLIEALSTDL